MCVCVHVCVSVRSCACVCLYESHIFHKPQQWLISQHQAVDIAALQSGAGRQRSCPFSSSDKESLMSVNVSCQDVSHSLFLPPCSTLSEALYMAVGFQAREEDVEEPEAKEEERGEQLGGPWASQFAANRRPPTEHQHPHVDEGEDGEERDGEGQGARFHPEDLSFGFPVYRCHGPGQADAQEHVDRVASCHVPDGSVCVLVLGGGHFAGKGV